MLTKRQWRKEFITEPYERQGMKICYLASPGVHTYRWLKYFVEKGHEVHLITATKTSSNVIDNVEIHELRRFGPPIRILNYLINSVWLMFQFRRLIRNLKPDIIHAHYIDDQKLLGAFSGFHPFVVTAWGSDILLAPKESKISRWIVKYVLKKADLITCDAEHIREALRQLEADPGKIHRILFGVDTQKFKPGPKNKRLEEELEIVDSPVIISLRHLNPLYNIETLISAMSLVLKEVPQAKLLLLGTGSQETMLKELSNSLGISDSVRFVGLVPEDDVPEYLASADICVSTALSDGGPGGIIEAMACELPVITTDFGENRKWVEDGINGFIIPPSNPDILASKIIHLLQNPAEMRKFGQINRQIIMERNNWEKEMGKVAKLYKKLILSDKH